MYFFNSLINKQAKFVPHHSKIITMYTCGPSAHTTQHIGNLRSHIIEDVFEKAFVYLGYTVKRAMCITDVGKMDTEGKDKMLEAMNIEGKTACQIADYNISLFRKDCKSLNISVPLYFIKTSEEIEMYIRMIQKMLAEGYAYIRGGNVWFDTTKKNNFYKLVYGKEKSVLDAEPSFSDLDDFELWITNDILPDTETWDSPFGKGRPGWHIQCSAIAIKYLGEKLDIHFGSKGAIFPHHSAEIAQSETFLECEWCNFWVHLAYLYIDGHKMGKSLGNGITVDNLISKGYDPLAFRLLVLNYKYDEDIYFSFDLLTQAQNKLAQIRSYLANQNISGEVNDIAFEKYDKMFKNEIECNMNTIGMLSLLDNLLKDETITTKTKYALISKWDTVLELDILSY